MQTPKQTCVTCNSKTMSMNLLHTPGLRFVEDFQNGCFHFLPLRKSDTDSGRSDNAQLLISKALNGVGPVKVFHSNLGNSSFTARLYIKTTNLQLLSNSPTTQIHTPQLLCESADTSVMDFVSSSAERPVMFHCVLICAFAHVVNTCVAYCETLKRNKTKLY